MYDFIINNNNNKPTGDIAMLGGLMIDWDEVETARDLHNSLDAGPVWVGQYVV